MNYFDKNKILTLSVVLLVIINLGILALLWFNRTPGNIPERIEKELRIPPPDRMPPPDRILPPDGGPKEFLIRELKMNDKQKQEYEKLVEQHQSDMKRIREKMRNDKDGLWDILSKSNNDSAAVERIASEIGADQKETEIITFRHFQKVKELCNDEQKKKFDEVINDALKMMGPNSPPPGSH